MNYRIFSRPKAKRFSYNVEEPTILISISDVDRKPVQLQRSKNLLDVLRLSFEDVGSDGEFPMTTEDGKKVIRFVNKYVNRVSCIAVNCEAGLSRSAGVCAALMRILEGYDGDVFSKYTPNPCCYKRVLEAFYGGYASDSVEPEEKENIISRINQNRYEEYKLL